MSRPISKWKTAFGNAKKVEAEGDEAFKDFQLPIGKKSKRKLDLLTSDDVTEDDIVTGGGFCQPLKLSKLVEEFKRNPTENKVPLVERVNTTTEGNPSILDEQRQNIAVVSESFDGVPKQICRAWFKNKYLRSGAAACVDPLCRRKHEITEKNPERLYKDYAFKGLSAVQRKRIMEEIRSEME